MEALIETRHLSKSFGNNTVLSGIDLVARPKQALAVRGPSGCGKSTLLSMLGLLLSPTEGTIRIKGIDVSLLDDMGLSRMRNESIGFVFQHAQLIGSLRAWENAAVPARVFPKASKLSKAQAKERSMSLLEQLGLAKRIYHYPHQLSVGQRRRIVVARALLMDPEIIIADEPTNDLDAESAKKVTDFLFARKEQGSTLIVATHDDGLAARADATVQIAQE